MGEAIKNLGLNQQVFVFVDGVKLGRDFKCVTDWEVEHQYYEGFDEHLGRKPVTGWKVYKISQFSFNFEEENASNVHAVIEGIDGSESNGVRADIRIVEFTENNDGTTSKAEFSKCTLKFKKTNGGKGEKIKYAVTGTGQKKLK